MIDSDPLFVEEEGGDFHITFFSPCRDAGSNASVPPDVPEDFEGDERIAGGTVDMGADEFFFHLYHHGNVTPGGVVEVRIIGGPGMPVRLALGSGVKDPPLQTIYGDLWIERPLMALFSIGSIGADGVLSYSRKVPSFWNPGEEKPFQALVGSLWGVNTRLTNLMVLQVE